MESLFTNRLLLDSPALLLSLLSQGGLLTLGLQGHFLELDLQGQHLHEPFSLESPPSPPPEEQETDHTFLQISQLFQVAKKESGRQNLKCLAQDQSQGFYYGGYADGSVVRYNMCPSRQEGECLQRHGQAVEQMLCQEGCLVYSLAGGEVVIRHTQKAILKSFSTSSQVTCMALLPQAALPAIVLVLQHQRLLLIDPNKEHSHLIHEQQLQHSIVTAQGQADHLYLGSIDGSLLFFTLEEGLHLTHSLDYLEGWVQAIKEIDLGSLIESEYPWLASLQTGLLLAVDRQILIYDLASFSLLDTLHGHSQAIVALEYADGLLVSSAQDSSILTWDLKEWASRLVHNYSMFREDIQSRQNMVYSGLLNQKKKGKKKKKK